VAQVVTTEDLPDDMTIIDPYVIVYLVGGDRISLNDISIMELSSRLGKFGFAYLADGKGGYLILFSHGVAAIQASNEPMATLL